MRKGELLVAAGTVFLAACAEDASPLEARHSTESRLSSGGTAASTTFSQVYYQQEVVPDAPGLLSQSSSSATNDPCPGPGSCTTFFFGAEDPAGNEMLPSVPAAPVPAAAFAHVGFDTPGVGLGSALGTLGVQTDFHGTFGIVIDPSAVRGAAHAWVIPQAAAGGTRMAFQDGARYQQFIEWNHTYQAAPDCSTMTACGSIVYMTTCWIHPATGNVIMVENRMWLSFVDENEPWASATTDKVFSQQGYTPGSTTSFVVTTIGDPAEQFISSCGNTSFSVGGSGQNGLYCFQASAPQFSAMVAHLNQETGQSLDTDAADWGVFAVNLDPEVWTDGAHHPTLAFAYNNHWAGVTGSP